MELDIYTCTLLFNIKYKNIHIINSRIPLFKIIKNVQICHLNESFQVRNLTVSIDALDAVATNRAVMVDVLQILAEQH